MLIRILLACQSVCSAAASVPLLLLTLHRTLHYFQCIVSLSGGSRFYPAFAFLFYVHFSRNVYDTFCRVTANLFKTSSLCDI